MRYRYRWVWLLAAVAVSTVALPDLGEAQVGEDARVQGRAVEHETGEPLDEVYVTLMPLGQTRGSSRTVVTPSEGTFQFAGVAPGRYVLSARKLGYGELVDTVQVTAGSLTDATLPLSVAALELEPAIVTVEARPVGPLRAFERRRVTTSGIFMDRTELNARDPQVFSDLLRTVAGVRLVPNASMGYRVRFRNGCEPDLWVDGTLALSTNDIDTMIQPEHLEAIEVYRGTEVPTEFGTNLCGAIVVWTRRGDPTTEARSLPIQLLYAAGVLVLALLTR